MPFTCALLSVDCLQRHDSYVPLDMFFKRAIKSRDEGLQDSYNQGQGRGCVKKISNVP